VIHFLLRVAGWGFVLGLGFSLAFHDWGNLGRYTLISAFFSALLGGGIHLLPRRWMEPAPGESPARAALRMQATWLGLCLSLVGLGLAVVGRWVGPGSLDAYTVIITLLVSLLLTSLAVGRAMAVALVARTQALERARARAGFLALRAQLQPHTLFNALNTILALVRPDPEGAEGALRNLSALLRQILAALEHESWTLQEECGLLHALLALERVRFGSRLTYEIHLPSEAEARPVPPLLLLPLVENSLKHGFRSKVGPCRVEVMVEPKVIRVVDDGVGRPEAPVEGVGLRTVRERLEACGGRLSWPPVTQGCEARVELP
jgi:hypothetical protein